MYITWPPSIFNKTVSQIHNRNLQMLLRLHINWILQKFNHNNFILISYNPHFHICCCHCCRATSRRVANATFWSKYFYCTSMSVNFVDVFCLLRLQSDKYSMSCHALSFLFADLYSTSKAFKFECLSCCWRFVFSSLSISIVSIFPFYSTKDNLLGMNTHTQIRISPNRLQI